jgi:endoglucanase
VRLTIDPVIFLRKPSSEKTAKLLAGTKAAIEEIRAAGLKVDVDMHSIPRDGPRDGGDPGTDQIVGDDALFTRYLGVVADVGKLVATYPKSDVAFELLNEPTLDCSYDLNGAKPRWPAMLQRLHAAGRAAAPDTTLILSGGCWGGADGLAELDPAAIKDENIIWSFHSYNPFIFSHQGASWTKDAVGYVSGLSFPPAKGSKIKIQKIAEKRIMADRLSSDKKTSLISELHNYLDQYYEPGAPVADARKPFEIVRTWAVKNHISPNRILLGEFGAMRGDKYGAQTDKARAPLIKLIRSEAEAHGFAWSSWSWSGSFGMSRTPDTRELSAVLLQALGMK